jgi:hypothetical protein
MTADAVLPPWLRFIQLGHPSSNLIVITPASWGVRSVEPAR